MGIAKAPGAKVLLAVPPPMANVAAPQPSNHCLSSSRLPMVLHPINQQSSTDQSAVAYAMGKRRPGNLPTPEIENTWWESCIELLYWRQLLCCGMEDRLRLAPVCMCVLQNWPSNEGFLRFSGPPSENGVDGVGVGAAAVNLGGACAGRRAGCGGPLRNGSAQVGAIEALVSALHGWVGKCDVV